jgi:hypothetical protein
MYMLVNHENKRKMNTEWTVDNYMLVVPVVEFAHRDQLETLLQANRQVSSL